MGAPKLGLVQVWSYTCFRLDGSHKFIFFTFCFFSFIIASDHNLVITLYLMNIIWQQVRLGWHDAGTYNKNIEEWPQCGGANGSLRFEVEQKHAANAGKWFVTPFTYLKKKI